MHCRYIDLDKIEKEIDNTLKLYGVDWKLYDNEYYESLKTELISKILQSIS